MRERPILFNDAMVRAILSGAKTQTRRPVKPQPTTHMGSTGVQFSHYGWSVSVSADRYVGHCPIAQPGDRLWVLTLIPIAGYEGAYSVGDDGHVYRVTGKSPRRLKGTPQSKGYLTVSLSLRGFIKTHAVHRLVAEAFYPSHDGLDVVRHLDGDPSNNDPLNLDWGTESQNRNDREAHGRGNGEAHHSAKLSRADIASIRASSDPQRALARRHGVSQSTIHAVRSGLGWKERSEAPAPNQPRWASRLTLRVTDVRVERVQDITEADARAEGAEPMSAALPLYRDNFRVLWSDTYGAESWASNPWVWVVSFERAVPHG